ncbi:phosphoribosylglycinamide formyltransferase [Melioribacteraceae bacterium 4301-Me]|uniref:phosphoribosylglycinamide formyltransferase n=1 Tax=Pyranulibacter aquaticus TaxID=3163344 RepID=UPI003595B343
MLNIAVFVSGRGSNLKSLYNSVPKNKVKIAAVVSNKTTCTAVEFAQQNKIDVFFVSEKIKEGFVSYRQLADILEKFNVKLIVLAGFLKKIPDEFIDKFENKIINIHPALLPSFGGKGMYGINVHKAVWESKSKVSGATVHFVDKIYDHGKIIYQKQVDISNVSGPDDIAAKVLKIEHEILPYVVLKFSEGKIKLIDDKVIIE